MRSLFYISIISVLALFSCNLQHRKIPANAKISIAGKWHRFSLANGYSEFDIDSQNVIFYNQKAGRFKLAYKIENDSFKYLTLQYAAKITVYGDSVFLEGNDNTTATLYRFGSDCPFTSIPDEKDSLLFESYLKGFDKRVIREYEKAGIEFLDNTEITNDTTFRQLLNRKEY